jgi:hypothetical protein
VNGRHGAEDLTVLIGRSAELKRDLVDFACSPRLQRSMAAAIVEAGLEEIDEGDAIGTIDRFALQYRLPDGQTVVDRFVASRPDLAAADREMLLGWRDPVEGIFEIRGKDGAAWSTGRTPTWARPRSGRCPGADSCSRGWCPSARCPAHGWFRG